MEAIEQLKRDHKVVEQHLIELEMITKSETINYPNLIHLIKTFMTFWDEHEEREEKVYNILNEGEYKIPIHKIVFQHGELKKIKETIAKAINSGSEFKIKETLQNEGNKLISELRKHMAYEDDLIYTLPIGRLEGNIIKKLEDLYPELIRDKVEYEK